MKLPLIGSQIMHRQATKYLRESSLKRETLIDYQRKLSKLGVASGNQPATMKSKVKARYLIKLKS